MADSKPLLALVMIVKNEARGIRETIASVRPFVDRYLILDTGSVDGTRALIREAFQDMPGEVPEGPFVDFSTTRNQALDLLGTRTTFTLMLSGDETLVHGEALRAFCETHRDARGPAHGAYYVRLHFGTAIYDSARLARTEAGWRYTGTTHEVLTQAGSDRPDLRVPGSFIFHDLSHRDPAGTRRRWELDRLLLTEEDTRCPGQTRTTFYLAQTLHCLGDCAGAFAAYERRIKLGGWSEEVYESLFRLAQIADHLGRSWPEVQQRYLDAYAHSPHRAEPLFAIAWHHYEQRNWPLSYLFAARAAQLPFPAADTLFVDAQMYHVRLPDLLGTVAYHVGEFEVGEAALRKVLERCPDDPRLRDNLVFYERRRKP